MEEIKIIGKNCFYLKSFSNIGIIADSELQTVFMIDSGSNDSLAKKLAGYLKINYGNYKFAVLHTHCHVDHIKGNYIFKKHLNADIFATKEEMPFGIYPDLEKYYLYSATAPKFFNNSFFSAKGVMISDIEELEIPFTILRTPGHSPGHIVLMYGESVFTGDLVFEKRIAEKYGYLYATDIGQYLESLDRAKDFKGNFFVPSHGAVMTRNEYRDSIDFNLDFVSKQTVEFLDYIVNKRTLDAITGYFGSIINFSGDSASYFLLRSFVSAMIKYHLEKNNIRESMTVEGMVFLPGI